MGMHRARARARRTLDERDDVAQVYARAVGQRRCVRARRVIHLQRIHEHLADAILVGCAVAALDTLRIAESVTGGLPRIERYRIWSPGSAIHRLPDAGKHAGFTADPRIL